MSERSRKGWQNGVRFATSALFIAAGLNHFRMPVFYRSIVPPQLPNPSALVWISGVCEVAGGVALLIKPLRRLAAWGLLALLVAVFPANLYMAIHPQSFHIAPWKLWLRLPLQLPIMVIVWFAGSGQSKVHRR